LLKVLEAQKRNAKCELVFHRNNQVFKRGLISHRFKAYVRLAKLDERLHFHSLRHTFATWLVRAKVPIYDVQKLLGHSSIVVTQVYSHLEPGELYEAVEKISLPPF
jgi:site-specific recombinase XerD